MILILNQESAWLYPSILMDSLKMDYPFQVAFVQPPPPHRKNRRRGVCGGGGDCTQASLRQTIHFVALVCNRPTTKCLCPVFLKSHSPDISERCLRSTTRTMIPTGLLCMTPMKRLVANTVYCYKKSIVAPPQFEIFTWFLTFLLIQTEADISF